MKLYIVCHLQYIVSITLDVSQLFALIINTQQTPLSTGGPPLQYPDKIPPFNKHSTSL